MKQPRHSRFLLIAVVAVVAAGIDTATETADSPLFGEDIDNAPICTDWPGRPDAHRQTTWSSLGDHQCDASRRDRPRLGPRPMQRGRIA